MIPENTINENKERSRKEQESLERLVSDIREDRDATVTEKRLASALIALKES